MIERSERYKKIGQRLIDTREEFKFIKEMGIRIAFLSSDEEKKSNRKTILADCTKISKRYEWCCKYDFMITVYEPNCLMLNKKQMEILIEHELHHVGVDFESADLNFYVVPHDIEEFWDVINEHGLHWQE